MQYESLLGSLPELPPTNAHDFFFNRPGQVEPADYIIGIDAVTGKKRMRSEFLRRVRDGVTALGSDAQVGGVGLKAGKQEMIGIFADNSLDYIVLVHALLALATPFALISAHCTPFELNHCLKKAKVTRLFVQPSFLAKTLKASKELGLTSDKIYILEGDIPGRHSLASLITQAKQNKLPQVAVRPVEKDTLAYLIFSSGTSGLPKAVMVSHSNIICSVMQYAIIMQESAKVLPSPPPGVSVALAVLPMYHTYGLHSYCFRPMLVPVTYVIMARWNLDLAIRCIPKYKVNVFLFTPSIAHTLVNSPKFMDKNLDLSSITVLGSGAAFLPPNLAQRLSSRVNLPSVATGYGLSEATMMSLGIPPPGIMGGKVKLSPGAAGVLVPGQSARIILDSGVDAGPSEIGELWLKGGNVTLGYYGDNKATEEAFLPNGWLKTGDRFRVDENQNFFFEDRAKDTLKVSGLQVSPKEIEEFILQNSSVNKYLHDVAVAGVITSKSSRTEDEKVPRAWIVLNTAGKKAGEREVSTMVEKAVEEGLSKYKWLRGGVEVVDSIPKSPTGKMLKRILVANYDKQRTLKAKL